MKTVTALLRDPAGVDGEYSYQIEDDFTEHDVEFMWADGNYACDCNRSLFLHKLPYDCAWPCGSKIRCVWLKLDGAKIYSESCSVLH